MNFLFSIHLFPPKHNCGSELVAVSVGKYLITQGHNVRVILHYYEGPMYMYEGIEVFPHTGSVDAYRWAHIIATHLDMSHFSFLIAREAKKPLIHFIHNDQVYDFIQYTPGSQYIVYNSEWIAKALNYPHAGITLHPPCDRDTYDIDRTGAEAITLISLNERKGGYLFSKIAEAMPNRKFIGVVGSYDNPGPLKLSQEQIIDRMPPNVEIVANSPAILEVYKRTRILLMPSDYESWGRTATEAMCSGIPVICTPTPGLKENCAGAAIYVGTEIPDAEPGKACVKLGQVDDWVKAIKTVDMNYKKYSLLCKQRAQQLDPKAELEKLHAFILEAAAKGFQ